MVKNQGISFSGLEKMMALMILVFILLKSGWRMSWRSSTFLTGSATLNWVLEASYYLSSQYMLLSSWSGWKGKECLPWRISVFSVPLPRSRILKTFSCVATSMDILVAHLGLWRSLVSKTPMERGFLSSQLLTNLLSVTPSLRRV